MASTPWYQGLSLYVILENFIPQVDFSLSLSHHLHEDITYFLLVSVIQSTKQPSKDHIHYTSNGLRAQKLTIIVLQVPFHCYTLSSWEEKKMSNQHFFLIPIFPLTMPNSSNE